MCIVPFFIQLLRWRFNIWYNYNTKTENILFARIIIYVNIYVISIKRLNMFYYVWFMNIFILNIYLIHGPIYNNIQHSFLIHRVSEWLLFNAKWAISSAISWREHVTFNEMTIMSVCSRPTCWVWFV